MRVCDVSKMRTFCDLRDITYINFATSVLAMRTLLPSLNSQFHSDSHLKLYLGG